MEIAKNFGLDPVLLSAQVINFLVVLYLLKRFLYKPMLTMLKNRKRSIEEGIQKAEEARLMLERATEKEKQMLQKAQEVAKKLLDDAKESRAELLKKAHEQTKKQVESMIHDAQEQIARETRTAEKRLSSYVSTLAVSFLEKSLSGMIDKRQQEEVVKRAFVRLKKDVN